MSRCGSAARLRLRGLVRASVRQMGLRGHLIGDPGVDLAESLARANRDPVEYVDLHPLQAFFREDGTLEPGRQVDCSGVSMAKGYSAVAHAVSAAVVIGGILTVSAVGYFGLLAWAFLSGQPLGGPLALPFVLLGAIVLSGLSVSVVLLPSTLLAELLARACRWPTLAEIPVSTALSVAICTTTGAFAGFFLATVGQGLRFGFVWAIALLVPLGAYWWCLQATGALLGLGDRTGRWFVSRGKAML